MTESDYILAGDLARVRAAEDILRGLFPYEKAALAKPARTAIKALQNLRLRLEWKIPQLKEGGEPL